MRSRVKVAGIITIVLALSLSLIPLGVSNIKVLTPALEKMVSKTSVDKSKDFSGKCVDDADANLRGWPFAAFYFPNDNPCEYNYQMKTYVVGLVGNLLLATIVMKVGARIARTIKKENT